MRQSAAPTGDLRATADTLRRRMGEAGLVEPRTEELAAGRELAAALIGPQIAAAGALYAIFERAGCGAYILRENGQVTGFVAVIPLNQVGLLAVCDDTFNAQNPQLEHVAASDQELAGVYGWGVAGANREAARTVVLGVQVALEVLPYPYFARAATEAGLRLVSRLGFEAYPGSTSGLLWRPPAGLGRRAA